MNGKSSENMVERKSSKNENLSKINLKSKSPRHSITPSITVNNEKLSPNDQNDKENESEIPLVLRKQGSQTNCSDVFIDSNCPCSGLDVIPKKSALVKPINFTDKRSLIPLERLNELRKKVQEAIKYHKVFTIRGCFYSIRKSLVQRGWVEKLDIHRKTIQNLPSNFIFEDLVQQLPARRPGESRRQHIAKCERNLMSRLLEYISVDFLWTCRKEKSDWVDMARNPTLILNKFNKVPYTSKEGLCATLKDFHWFYEEGTAELYFPRCYNVWNPEELNEFIENFRITACISVLRWLTDTFKQKGSECVASTGGKIPFTCIDFAITRCSDFIATCLHYDIDNDDPGIKIWEHDWEVFYTHHFLLTHENAKLQIVQSPIESLVTNAERTLHDIKCHWPQFNLDGYLNIWIVKPGNRCRGRGIQVMNSLKDIVTLINPQIVTKTRYVVQKYIERPLIIHNTKFDIRQWFLVTSVQPLVVWMYKESYLRFSSQEYNLKNHHESVHLTNHAIQKKYTNCVRDERLPHENMWDCFTFQAYLRQIGQVRMWNERIYPGMQKAIVGTMLASQDNMDRRPHSFELFGADFMISEDFYPWLIEINSSPDLGATTSVTARLCPQCLEDTIKVVIDRRNNPNIDTGSFEMIYKQIIPPAPAYMGLNLYLKGQQILPKASAREKKFKEDMRLFRSSNSLYNRTKSSVQTQGPVIVDFMECLNMRAKSSISTRSTTPRDVKKINGGVVLKKHNFPTTNLAKIHSNKYLNIRSSINRVSGKSNANGDKNARSEFLRRHASCGPRYMQVQTDDSLVSPKDSENDKTKENKKEQQNIKKELQCVGNKCLEKVSTPNTGQTTTQSDWELSTPTIPQIVSSPSSTSSRKQSIENLYKSKSATTLNGHLRNLRKTQHNSSYNNNFRKFLPHHNPNESNLSLNTNNIKASVQTNKILHQKNSKTNSNFFAVGLSLRAWRAKYSKIVKTQRETLQHSAPVIRSCPSSLVSRCKSSTKTVSDGDTSVEQSQSIDG